MHASTSTLASGDRAAEAKPSGGERFLFIDGLRGVAATSVLVFDVFGYFAVGNATAYSVPMRRVIAISRVGFVGVEIFFALSGFVIAHSLRHCDYSVSAIVRFIVTRSIRLDPPYWATIAGVLLVGLAGRVHGSGRTLETITVAGIAAHLFYVQDILHISQLLSVFWTLCPEVRFYLVFVLVGFLALKLTSRRLHKTAHATDLASLWPSRWGWLFLGVRKLPVSWAIGTRSWAGW